MSGLEGVDPRNLARVRTQVWFASQALKGMVASSGDAYLVLDEMLGPTVRLLDLAQIKLSDLIEERPAEAGQAEQAGEAGFTRERF